MSEKTVLVVDDEPAARRELIALLSDYSLLSVVGEAPSSFEKGDYLPGT